MLSAMDKVNGRSWVEISLPILMKNYEIYKSQLPDGIQVMAVVKANAYGHGDTVVAKYLYDNGVRYFAVSNVDEAIHIRNAGVGGKILILGFTPFARARDLVEYDITQALLSEEYAERLSKESLPIKSEFAIDTGMRRIGLNADDPASCEKVIRRYRDELGVDGLFTHLCVADCDDSTSVEFTKNQISKFHEVMRRVEDLNLPFCHCLNSAGGLWHSAEFSCFARLGIILYGLKPDYLNTLPSGIRPALTWKSSVSMVKEICPGDTVGYGRTFMVDKVMRIATIPTGYADGYNRLLSNKGIVLINGCQAPIIGRICMDQLTVDVTHIPDVHMETEVVLLGESGNQVFTADDMAHLIGTIGYEIVCGISKRVDRVYINK